MHSKCRRVRRSGNVSIKRRRLLVRYLGMFLHPKRANLVIFVLVNINRKRNERAVFLQRLLYRPLRRDRLTVLLHVNDNFCPSRLWRLVRFTDGELPGTFRRPHETLLPVGRVHFNFLPNHKRGVKTNPELPDDVTRRIFTSFSTAQILQKLLRSALRDRP